MPTTTLAPIFAEYSYSRVANQHSRLNLRDMAMDRAKRALQEEFARQIPDAREWELETVGDWQAVSDDEQRLLLGGLPVLKRPQDAEIGEFVAGDTFEVAWRGITNTITPRLEGESIVPMQWQLRKIRLRPDLLPVEVWERVA